MTLGPVHYSEADTDQHVPIKESLNLAPPSSTFVAYLSSPQELIESLPLSSSTKAKICGFRSEITEIVQLRSPKWLVIVGPCSIHDPAAALAYARKLSALSSAVSDVLLVVMRVYFEKPRTVIGWKGLINDPNLDGSCDIHQGLRVARQLMLQIAELSVPIACEFLDPITPAFFSDLVSWGAIGARTSESQVHRELASALPLPIGFKNGTEGSPDTALDAILAASTPQTLISYQNNGRIAVTKSAGNSAAHLVLRGGHKGPNFNDQNVTRIDGRKRELGIQTATLIDCSHGNSNKDWRKQSSVARQVVQDQVGSNTSVRGLMIESNLLAGAQDINEKPLKYGVSVTDGCIGWDETEALVFDLAAALRATAFSDEASTGDIE
jgi:3-deoxy-7-phosphoheptulonate synthase